MGKPKQDVALLTGPTEDKKGMRIVRFRDEAVSLGEVRPVTEGQPLTGEVITLRPREGAPPFVRDVETVYAPQKTDGPAQVASDAYRQNWEVVFGKDPEPASIRDLN
jgi:hypothetical protein